MKGFSLWKWLFIYFLDRCVGDVREYNVKWKELGYDEVTWEVEDDVTAFQAEIDKYKSIMARPSKKRKRLTLDSNKDLKRQRKDFKPYTTTPNFLVGGTSIQFAC